MSTAGPRRAPARATSILPRGSGIGDAWLLVTGLASYGFLTTTGRALGPDRYGGLSALWALGFLLGPNACLAGGARGVAGAREPEGPGPGRRPAGQASAVGAGVLAAVLVVVALVSGPWLVEDLFDDDVLLLVGLVKCSRALRSSTWCAVCSPATPASDPTASFSAPKPGADPRVRLVARGVDRGRRRRWRRQLRSRQEGPS